MKKKQLPSASELEKFTMRNFSEDSNDTQAIKHLEDHKAAADQSSDETYRFILGEIAKNG